MLVMIPKLSNKNRLIVGFVDNSMLIVDSARPQEYAHDIVLRHSLNNGRNLHFFQPDWILRVINQL